MTNDNETKSHTGWVFTYIDPDTGKRKVKRVYSWKEFMQFSDELDVINGLSNL